MGYGERRVGKWAGGVSSGNFFVYSLLDENFVLVRRPQVSGATVNGWSSITDIKTVFQAIYNIVYEGSVRVVLQQAFK